MGGFKGLSLVLLAASLCACGGSGTSAPSFNLEPLQPFTGVRDWSMAGGGPSHSGYVPVTLDTAHFTPRWSVVLAAGSQACNKDAGGSAYGCVWLTPAVTDSADGRVVLLQHFLSGNSGANPDEDVVTLFGLDEKDGSVAWKVSGFQTDSDQGVDVESSDPSTADGRVYFSHYVFISNIIPTQPTLFAYAAGDGAREFAVHPPCGNNCGGVTQPVVVDSGMYTGDPLSAYDSSSGALLWTATGRASEPAVDAQAVYYSNTSFARKPHDPVFMALEPASGAPLYQIPSSAAEDKAGAIDPTPPALDGMGGSIVQWTQFLDRYSLSTHALDWEVAGDFNPSGYPVVAKGVVYACEGGGVSAYDDSDGLKLWSWTPSGDSTLVSSFTNIGSCSLVVTDDLLFVGSRQATYAVDLTSHAARWTYPEGGALAISPSGLLYISVRAPTAPGPTQPDFPSHLVAINLH